ncbi:MAG: hypothetical protein GBAus27B_000306 [Mycoplasmataceae bacterium]|nr:MAG: hypothetical protein GBAus27B_000306 [Mycoplasmataceae bacterium]
MFGINLSDWKASLNELLTNNLKTPLEAKANDLQADLNKKFAEFKASNNKFQQTAIAILFATFLVITISYTLKDNINHD